MFRRTVLGCAILVLPVLAGAQSVGWSGSVEASGNVLFGAAPTRLLSFNTSASRADSTLEAQTDFLVSYADAPDDNTNGRLVTARTVRFALGADHRPFDRVTRFVFGTFESSLQQRVARRFAGGAGAKLTFYRRAEDDVSTSLALLWERTHALKPDSNTVPIRTNARWSLRFRVRRQLSNAVRFSHVTFYQPAFDRPSRYVADANTALLVTISKALELSATLRDRYDSESRSRGARSNHDGQLLFGVRASF